MASIIVRPAHVAVTVDNPLNPSVVVGGDSALSDDSDLTYAEVSTTVDPGPAGIGDVLTAIFPSVIDTGRPLISASLNMRFRYQAEAESAGGGPVEYGFNVESWLDPAVLPTDYIGTFQTGTGYPLSSVPAAGTYDLDGPWSYFRILGGSPFPGTVAALADEHFSVQISALSQVTFAGYWTLRVYELALVLTYETPANPAPRRRFPLDRRIYPPPRVQQGRRRAGGYT